MIDLKGSKRVGVKLSGGADSAIALFLICKQNTDLEYILPITLKNKSKPFNFYYANQILDWTQEQFPLIKFERSYFGESEGNEDYVEKQVELTRRVLEDGVVDCIVNGITLVPQTEDFSSTENGPYEERTLENLGAKKESFSPVQKVWFLTPFWDKDKRGIAKLYEDNDLMDSLFPLTRSCEGFESMEKHCGKCWHCNEREWAFGRLD